jgi:hypothetical protein
MRRSEIIRELNVQDNPAALNTRPNTSPADAAVPVDAKLR